MSKEQLDRFLAQLADNDALRKDFGTGSLSAAKIVETATRHGFQFTSNELLLQARPLADDEWADAARRLDGNHSDSYILFLEEAPMSKEALNAFFKKVADDEGLQKKLVEFAVAQGFEFSAEELSDSDLDSVAGGLLSTVKISPTAIKVEDLTAIKVESLLDHKVEDLTDIKIDNLKL